MQYYNVNMYILILFFFRIINLYWKVVNKSLICYALNQSESSHPVRVILNIT